MDCKKKLKIAFGYRNKNVSYESVYVFTKKNKAFPVAGGGLEIYDSRFITKKNKKGLVSTLLFEHGTSGQILEWLQDYEEYQC